MEIPNGWHVITKEEYNWHVTYDAYQSEESEEEEVVITKEAGKRGRPPGRPTDQPKSVKKRASKKVVATTDGNDTDEDAVEEDGLDDDVASDPEPEEEDVHDVFVVGRGRPIVAIPWDAGDDGRRPFSRWADKTPYQIFTTLIRPILNHVVRCTNRNIDLSGKDVQELSYGEMAIWVACNIYFGLVPMHSVEAYWYPHCMGPLVTTLDLRPKMTYTRFKEIKGMLRYAIYEDVLEVEKTRDILWKFRPTFLMFKTSLRSIFDMHPGKHLSGDETMIRITSKTFPARRKQPKKPTSTGCQLTTLVDHQTKIMIDADTCDGIVSAATCRGMPWGASGESMLMLVRDLVGKGYILHCDNHYGGIPLTKELLRLGIHINATITRARTHCPELTNLMGTAKRCTPTLAVPKGTWKHAGNSSNTIVLHAHMDTTAVFVIDSAHGTTPQTILRRSGAVRAEFNSSAALCMYNNKMGGVDCHDQLHGGLHYSTETTGRNSKWTTIMFLAIVSMTAVNTFCIHRAHHPEGEDGHLSHIECQAELFTSLWAAEHNQVPRPCGRPMSNPEKHGTLNLPEGTRTGVPHGRGRGVCKHCPGGLTTRDYCSVCKVFIHSYCMVAYHEKTGFKVPKPDAAILRHEPK